MSIDPTRRFTDREVAIVLRKASEIDETEGAGPGGGAGLSLEDLKEIGVVARVVQNLLPVLDNFERAISSASPEEAASSLHQGVQLIFRQILDELRREGLEAVQTLGQPFDPTVHEAVATEHHPDLPHHTIMEELQRGYTLHQRLLRPALVKVSTDPGAGDMEPSGNEGS